MASVHLPDHATERCAQLHLEAGDPAAARPILRDALRVEPYDERLWRALLRAEHAAGNTGAVRNLAGRLRSVLEEGLGEDPQPETEDLLRTLLQRRATS